MDYAVPVRKPPQSVWSVVGLALALLCLFPPVMMWWLVAKAISASRSIGNGSIHHSHLTLYVGITPLMPVIPICLCLIGLRRGRKNLAVLGIIISAVAMLAMGVLVIKPSW